MRNRLIHISTFLLLILAICPLSASLKAQSRDTVLNMVLSKPNFYNVIKTSKGKIFAGTTNGILEINGTELRQYGSTVGYLRMDKNGEPVIDKDGVQYYSEKKLAHLLPYPEMAREEYHAATENLLYICSGGRLYIFDILPFEYSYPNHSFRTISKDLLGTYSGIYLKGKKTRTPFGNYTDGYIRQFGNRAFVCNYEILVLEKDALDSGIPRLGENCFIYNPPTKGLINDIFPTPDNQQYYVATQEKLLLTNYDFTHDTVLYISKNKALPIGLITEDKRALMFFDHQLLLRLDNHYGGVTVLTKLNEPILAGVALDKQVYLITGSGIYRYNSSQQVEKLIDIQKGHTMIALSGSELVISSDQGLYLFNIASRELSIIIKGIEFNRKALHKNDNSIYAGSINGLYTIKMADIPKLVENNKSNLLSSTSISSTISITIIFAVLVILLGLIAWRFRKKLKTAEQLIENIQSSKEDITREKIEQYIIDHLSNASIKTIMDAFNLNGKQLYVILKPDKPGSIIQNIRLETLKKMREEKKTIQEIATATGLSVSYLRKLK